MTDTKNDLSLENYGANPFFKSNNMIEYYDDAREDQFEEYDNFSNMSQNLITQNVYDKYKSFFYRYQDYNQINR
jgi:hypothetical protein